MDPKDCRHSWSEHFEEASRDEGIYQCKIVVFGDGGVEDVNAYLCQVLGYVALDVEQDIDDPSQIPYPMTHEGKKHHGGAITTVGMRSNKNFFWRT